MLPLPACELSPTMDAVYRGGPNRPSLAPSVSAPMAGFGSGSKEALALAQQAEEAQRAAMPSKAARLLGVKQAAAEDAEAAEDLRIRELILAQEKAASAQRADSLVAPGPTLGRRVSAEL